MEENNIKDYEILLSEKKLLKDDYYLEIADIKAIHEWRYFIFKSDELITSQSTTNYKEPQYYETLKSETIKNTAIILSIKLKIKELNINIDDYDIIDAFLNCNNDILDMTILDENKDPYKPNYLLNINEDSDFYKKEIKPILDKINKFKINKTYEEVETLIINNLKKHKKPSEKLLSDFMKLNKEFYIDYNTQKKYMKTPNGFKEITSESIAEYFNDKFGDNEISLKSCENTIDYITKGIETEYNLIMFKNGTLNTDTGEFKEKKYNMDVLPKIKTDLTYYPNAEKEFKKTDLYHEIKEILYYPKWNWNEDLFYKMVGATMMATNNQEKLIVIHGKPNSGKTTLLSILKRIFSYSEIKLQTIAKNERFQLIDCIGKDINIDDDIQGFIIEEIGTLNSFVSGAGMNVEFKGKNKFVHLTAETTPILWNSGNKLPTVKGDGWKRRIVIVKANNEISEINNDYKRDITKGKRDNEISLLFSYAYQIYYKNRASPVISKDIQEVFLEEWEWKSYPAKKAAEILFIDSSEVIRRLEDVDEVDINSIEENRWQITYELFIDDKEKKKGLINTYVTVKEVNKLLKQFFKEAYKMGLIVEEQSKPNIRTFKSAMEAAGFSQINKHILYEDGRNTTEKVYDDCILNPEWLEELKNLI